MAHLLILIRHLETISNREKRFGSGETDDPLLPGQHWPNASIVHPLIQGCTVRFAHTGLLRTQQTLALVQGALGAPTSSAVELDLFRERFAGKFAGKTFEEMQALYPKLRVPSDLWQVDAPEHGLESIPLFMKRIEEGLEIVKRDPSDVVLLVAHAGTLKAVQASSLPSSQWQEALLQPTPANGAVTVRSLQC